MRMIASVKSRNQLIEELEKIELGLRPKTRKQMENMSVTSMVMAVRAVNDPANRIYDAIYNYDIDYRVASEITEAIEDAGFMFIESRDSYLVRVFLAKTLGDTIDPMASAQYGTVEEYEARRQFPEAKIAKFSQILNGLLEPQEYQAVCLKSGVLVKKWHPFDECAKIMGYSEKEFKNVYDLAMAKLYGDKNKLKEYGGYSWLECRKYARRARVAQKRLARLYYNGGYFLRPENASAVG